MKRYFEPEPNWEPFVFQKKPGYRLTGHIITRYDDEGLSSRMDSIPADATKAAEPNHWNWRVGLCHYIIIASPVYETPKKLRVGDCANCAVENCEGHYKGRKCCNYWPK